MRRCHLALLAVTAVCFVAAAGSPAAEAERPLELGLTDSVYLSNDAAERQLWFDRTVDARAEFVLLVATWRSIAPVTPPAGFDPSNPADPAYSFGALDAGVRDAAARGLGVMMLVTGAPDWAEGPNRPELADARAGTWRPDPEKFAQFGTAIATRYNGSFTDPAAASAGPLPRVARWQAWAEPNLSTYLTPQFDAGNPASSDHYRRMLNAFYESVKAVSADNFVVTGGTAPYGDPPGGQRLPPVSFWRDFFCFKGKKLKGVSCPDPGKLDAIAHHPINVGQPRREALNVDDASTPDLGKIDRILKKAERTGRVQPAGEKRFWATEIWWDSNPPDPDGVPAATQARWLAESFYLMWRQGVDTAVWLQIRDALPEPSFGATPQTGLFLRDGTAKLAYEAFRFPFVGDRLGKGKVRVWGKAPTPGPVVIQRMRGGGWQDVKQVNASANRVFSAAISLRGKALLRAQSGTETSLPWRQR